MKLLTLTLILFTTITHAQLENAPENFRTKYGKAVFVDFKKAMYAITYHRWRFKADVVSYIDFEMPTQGHPMFDLLEKPTKVLINGDRVYERLISTPDKATKMRLVLKSLPPGRHQLVVHHKMKKGVRPGFKGVSSAFLIRDLKDRKMLERYVPTNYEYDQYKMTIHAKVKGAWRKHNVFANGNVEEIKKNEFVVTFPESYTSSSLYFHLVPKSKFYRLYSTFTSMDGRKIPMTFYSHSRILNWMMKKRSLKVLRELEKDYGPYAHPQLIVYGLLKTTWRNGVCRCH
jgi:hypothetical protein